MANAFIKAEQIVQAALLLLQREIVLPRLVWTQAASDFVGAKDDTINLTVPAVLTARTRVLRAEAGLTADDLTETTVPVKLDTHVYSLLNITDEQLTLDIRSFAGQVLSPQMRAVAEELEDLIVAALEASTNEAADITVDEDSPKAFVIAANRALNDLNVPRAGRVIVVGSAIEEVLLSDDSLTKVNESGTSEALRDAVIARLFGFTIVGSNAVDANTAYAFHRTAVAFGIVAPALPDGAAMKARASTEGLAMRYLRDYNPTNSTGPVDRSLVDSFAGADPVETGAEGEETNKRLVKITLAGS